MLFLRLEENMCQGPHTEGREDNKKTPHTTPSWSHNTIRLTGTGGVERLKQVSWINVSSRPHSAVCSHTLHNPSKSCHCKCTLNESLSIPRLAEVRCD